MVGEAAACNFFVAIARGQLVVTIEDLRASGGSSTEVLELNRDSLRETLSRYRERQRSKAFLSGEKADAALRTFDEGERYSVALPWEPLRFDCAPAST